MNKMTFKQRFRDELVPYWRTRLTELVGGCHEGWLWLGLIGFVGANVAENTFAAFFSFIPILGPWAVDNVLDVIVGFVTSPLPLACSAELARRYGWLKKP
jgi:hypothetical protein